VRMYNSEVAERYYKADKERRAKANKKGEIWTYRDRCAMAVKL
jgi:hypothetical protein